MDSGFTRYPLCEGDRDHVIGMVHIKDLLAIAGDPEADVRTIKREIIGVPETKPIDELLKELQKSHTHQAVVVDEYGGTAGLVTLEDIIEELIGEIQDEHDQPLPLLSLDEVGRAYSVAGTVALDEVSETLGVPIDNPADYDTIGGYALHALHLPPRHGATARLDGFDVSVMSKSPGVASGGCCLPGMKREAAPEPVPAVRFVTTVRKSCQETAHAEAWRRHRS